MKQVIDFPKRLRNPFLVLFNGCMERILIHSSVQNEIARLKEHLWYLENTPKVFSEFSKLELKNSKESTELVIERLEEILYCSNLKG